MLVVSVFLFGFTANAGVKELTFVCEDKEDFPFLIGNQSEIDPIKPGVYIEGFGILGEKLGIKIRFRRVPWQRAFEIELKEGRADGLFSASYKKEREDFGIYPMKNGNIDESRRLATSTYVFYRLKGSDTDYDGKELKNLNGNIGAPRGYSVVDDLKKKGYTIRESASTLTDMMNLIEGRVVVVAALELTGDNILKKYAKLNQHIEKIKTPIAIKAYYLMLSKQFVNANPELAEKIWNVVKEIREKNYPELIKKY